MNFVVLFTCTHSLFKHKHFISCTWYVANQLFLLTPTSSSCVCELWDVLGSLSPFSTPLLLLKWWCNVSCDKCVHCGGTRLVYAVHQTLPYFVEVSLTCETGKNKSQGVRLVFLLLVTLILWPCVQVLGRKKEGEWVEHVLVHKVSYLKVVWWSCREADPSLIPKWKSTILMQFMYLIGTKMQLKT